MISPNSHLSLSKLNRRVWIGALALASLIELFALWLAGRVEHPWVHPSVDRSVPENRFVEAELFQPPAPEPEEPHLNRETQDRPTPEEPATPEHAISTEAGRGKEASAEERRQLKAEPQNVVQSSHLHLSATHGPIAVHQPSPTIPEYLRNEEFKTSVLIEFLVTAQGAVTPRLLESSGNEELDVLALNAARLWQFRPAEEDHRAIDSRVKLRMIFEVSH